MLFFFFFFYEAVFYIIVVSLNCVFSTQLKTGGLVVWSRKDTLVIYRGYNYQLISKSSSNMHSWLAGGQKAPSSKLHHLNLENGIGVSRIKSNTTATTVDENIFGKDVKEDVTPTSIFMEVNFGNNPIDRSLYEREGLAFHPLDGILQAVPHVIALFIVPTHFTTHIGLLFLEAIWTANIHDCIHAKLWPVMGAGYHTIHHTTYRHNYGHYTVWMDWMLGTLRDPGDDGWGKLM
ncbi:hypothetical protein ACOSQ2_026451 [Xanthoceras sorbifolium]